MTPLGPGRPGFLLSAVAVAILLAAPGGASAQESSGAGDTVQVAAKTSESGAAPLQERWAAPFAVLSVGRPAGRGLRPVVVLAPPAPAPPPAAAQLPASTPAPPASQPRPRSTAAAPPARTRTPARPVAGTRTHRVEWGETWYGIAREYGVAPRDLAAANPGVDPERLRSGAVLRIPRSAAGAGRRTHRVAAGETLWAISRRYGISAAELRRANRLPDDRVRTGQLLIIPREEKRP